MRGSLSREVRESLGLIFGSALTMAALVGLGLLAVRLLG